MTKLSDNHDDLSLDEFMVVIRIPKQSANLSLLKDLRLNLSLHLGNYKLLWCASAGTF